MIKAIKTFTLIY